MKNKIGLLSFAVKKVDDDGDYVKIRGMASTDDVDRMGDIMDPDCWAKGGLDNYSNNPIILFNHDYDQPIGKATDIKIVENGLEIEAQISKIDDKICRLVKDGILSTFSVGFRVKEADYMKETGGLLITDAELFEISVVSVPANQAATFEVVKCFSSEAGFDAYKKTLEVPTIGNTVDTTTKVDTDPQKESKTMDPNKEKDLDLASHVKAAVAMAMAEDAAKRKAAEEAATKAKAEEEARLKAATDVAIEAGKSGAERLLEEAKKAFDEKSTAQDEKIEELTKALKDSSEEVMAFTKSKRAFHANNAKDWKTAFEKDIADAHLLGVVTEKGYETNFAKELMEKVNTFSGIEAPPALSVDVFETIASTQIERDIQNALVIAPLFREIAMNSASMIMPILPDAGYAEFTTAAGGAAYTSGKGNLRARGDALTGSANGVDLGQKVLTTNKLMSVSFLANDTQEDMILPVLPLLQESMVRSHARAVEHAFLFGGHSTAVNPGGFDGLVEFGKDNSTNVQSATAFNSDALTAANLMTMRKSLGKYGIKPSDVVYLISERAYFELIEDPEYQDVNLVGADLATKRTGEVGRVYGSSVLLVDEFNTPAVSEFHAVALNPRNFIVPRLRGITLESDYRARLQHRELIATQRLGFEEIIEGATAVVARNYSANAT